MPGAHPGGFGAPPGGTRTACQELADREAGQVPSQEKRGPGDLKASRWSVGRRAVLKPIKAAPHRKVRFYPTSAARRSTSPRFEGPDLKASPRLTKQ